MPQRIVRTCDMPVDDTHPDQLCPHEVTGEETLFSADGRTFKMLLCAEHHLELDRALARFVKYADFVRVPNPLANPNARKNYKGAGGKVFTAYDVRRWLQDQGQEVPPSGRLPKEVIEQYAKAHA